MNVTNLLQTAVMAGLSLLEPEAAFHPEPVGRIEAVEVEESSGLANSRQHPGLWWTHNDSGHTNHLFPMSDSGAVLGPPVEIEGAVNVDWEDISADDRGQLWISDLGNNRNRRRDLKVYVIDEPLPVEGVFPESVPVKRVLRMRYPDQDAFPPEKRNFDSEGIFVRDQILYVLTKHRSDADTKLYRLADDGGDAEQVLEYIQTFPEIGMVTGAALHPDGRRLAVLTYTGVWLFETDGQTERFLSGRISNVLTALRAWGQVEGIDWLDDETLLISNEQRDLFRIPLKVLTLAGE
ncbi:MAG: hypothetical protein JJU05_01415 [Verrucomicrobia bacterium]|nr:hypothetical protein [Verrucomicrobiota bacterium]MCH8528287.1 hypothetical protein [Kiritimatiellia bacterium]